MWSPKYPVNILGRYRLRKWTGPKIGSQCHPSTDGLRNFLGEQIERRKPGASVGVGRLYGQPDTRYLTAWRSDEGLSSRKGRMVELKNGTRDDPIHGVGLGKSGDWSNFKLPTQGLLGVTGMIGSPEYLPSVYVPHKRQSVRNLLILPLSILARNLHTRPYTIVKENMVEKE